MLIVVQIISTIQKYADKCSIIGVRKQESKARSTRTALVFKNKTTMKKLKADVKDYFLDKCQSVGGESKIQLLPIVDWSDKEVWQYIKKHNLPINPEYKYKNRVGCIVCPKADMNTNYKALLKYPKLIDAFCRAKETSPRCDYEIQSENLDLSNDKVQYICRWLNHSFMPFTPKQQKQFEQVKENYLKMKNKE